METFAWTLWLLLSVWGVVRAWRRRAVGRHAPRRRAWLGDWGGAILALSVGSFAPALAPHSPPWLQAMILLGSSAGLLRLMHALDSADGGRGVVAGLGLLALFLDSLSGGAWACEGALGHGTDARGIGDLYGALAILWGLIVCRAWLAIEGNPLGVAYLMGALALWLGWAGLSPALGWGATLTAITLSLLVIQRELTERRRVRLALQNLPMRVVRVAKGYDLMGQSAVVWGLCALALWRSGSPTLAWDGLSPHEGWHLAIVILCLVGTLRTRTVRPLPPALQRAWLIGTVTTALLSTQPMGVVALSVLLYWGLVGAILQETSAPMPNLSLRTGGNE
ncbi:MAG: hypothetical protein P3X24_007940 [bacterium]|nr:hypothetical protein [bacterium]